MATLQPPQTQQVQQAPAPAPATVAVKFTENVVVTDHRGEVVEAYEAGETVDLKPSSARHWLERRKAERVQSEGGPALQLQEKLQRMAKTTSERDAAVSEQASERLREELDPAGKRVGRAGEPSEPGDAGRAILADRLAEEERQKMAQGQDRQEGGGGGESQPAGTDPSGGAGGRQTDQQQRDEKQRLQREQEEQRRQQQQQEQDKSGAARKK